jgi:hypothetical protein
LGESIKIAEYTLVDTVVNPARNGVQPVKGYTREYFLVQGENTTQLNTEVNKLFTQYGVAIEPYGQPFGVYNGAGIWLYQALIATVADTPAVSKARSRR